MFRSDLNDGVSSVHKSKHMRQPTHSDECHLPRLFASRAPATVYISDGENYRADKRDDDDDDDDGGVSGNGIDSLAKKKVSGSMDRCDSHFFFISVTKLILFYSCASCCLHIFTEHLPRIIQKPASDDCYFFARMQLTCQIIHTKHNNHQFIYIKIRNNFIFCKCSCN